MNMKATYNLDFIVKENGNYVVEALPSWCPKLTQEEKHDHMKGCFDEFEFDRTSLEEGLYTITAEVEYRDGYAYWVTAKSYSKVGV